jgi:signal transduction histidine kinase
LKEQAALRDVLKATFESKGAVRDQFLMSVSHELRTPLNGMMGALQLLTTQENLR